jgi:hypothetical protein
MTVFEAFIVTTVPLRTIKSTACFWAKINCGRKRRNETKNKMFSLSIAEFTTFQRGKSKLTAT